MAVIVKYVVVRDGVEKMTFTTKKEADAYDRMLDIAENLHGLMGASGLDLSSDILENLALYLAEHRDQVGAILKGGPPRIQGDDTSGGLSEKSAKKTTAPRTIKKSA